MKTSLSIARYGIHYHATVTLIPNATVRTVFQCLIDLVRKQLLDSLDNQTLIITLGQIGRLTGIDAYRTIPSCITKLEALGLIKKHKNGITVSCDEYVAAIQLCETLPKEAHDSFIKEFHSSGVKAVQEYKGTTKLQGREELIGTSGSSITLPEPMPLQKCSTCNTEGMITCKNVDFSDTKLQNPTFLQGWEYSKNATAENSAPTFLQILAQEIAETLHFCRGYCNFEEFCDTLDPTFLQGDAFELVKTAFETGKFPDTFTFELSNPYIFAGSTPTFLQILASKSLHFCRTVIIYRIKKKNKGAEPKTESDQNEEIEENDSKDIFAKFRQVEIIDLNEPSEEVKEDLEPLEEVKKGLGEVKEISQQVIQRADRTLRERNKYRKKPFIKPDRVADMIEYLDETVESPVDFFINQFWQGIYELYLDHYNPSIKTDENGEPIDDSEDYNWREPIGAPLPQDEVYSLARNVYDDLLGAVEQGKFVYGGDNAWEAKMGFKSFEDFNPFHIFQWTPCTMQDKSIPALQVAIDKFYDIEAKDVFTPSRADKKVKSAQNRRFVKKLLETEPDKLTPIEAAIKKFYDDFVILGPDNVVDDFTDGRGTVLECCGALPDHLLKPWCIGLPSVRYDDLVGVIQTKYKPCNGVHRGASIFSAELVVEWNERNGYRDSIAHTALQEM